MNTNEYAGFKNYPTWAVNLHLMNNENMYADVGKMVKDCIENHTDEDEAINVIAYLLSEYVNECSKECQEDFGLDYLYNNLIDWSLNQVAWRDLAKMYYEEGCW